jgi:predicted nucleic acid-binding protein
MRRGCGCGKKVLSALSFIGFYCIFLADRRIFYATPHISISRSQQVARRVKIYMDVCCLNRPFDDQTQSRVRYEAVAITDILARCRSGRWVLAASEAIEFELSATRDKDKLSHMRELYSIARNRLVVTEVHKVRVRILQEHGLSFFDSLHLALAEASGQDIFLTTDDKLLKQAGAANLNIRVANPVIWFMEVEQ